MNGKHQLCGQLSFNGLIQHSFALRTHEQHRPFTGRNVTEMVKDRFDLSSGGSHQFVVRSVDERGESASHSPLVRNGLSTLQVSGIPLFNKQCDGSYTNPLPDALGWAGDDRVPTPWERFVFTRDEERTGLSLNDFLVVTGSDEVGAHAQEGSRVDGEGEKVTQALCELLAQRRSMLFGIAMASRFVNVMLPHALLEPVHECERDGWGAVRGRGRDRVRRDRGRPDRGRRDCGRPDCGRWIVAPLVSLIRMSPDGGDLRRVYSLTFFLVPVTDDCAARKVSADEIRFTVPRAGWPLATAPANVPRFNVHGPLCRYISSIDPPHGLDLCVGRGDSSSGSAARRRPGLR